jgi:hypothetical protein
LTRNVTLTGGYGAATTGSFIYFIYYVFILFGFIFVFLSVFILYLLYSRTCCEEVDDDLPIVEHPMVALRPVNGGVVDVPGRRKKLQRIAVGTVQIVGVAVVVSDYYVTRAGGEQIDVLQALIADQSLNPDRLFRQ